MEPLSQRPFIERHALWIALVGVALIPFVAAGAVATLGSNTNEVKDWLPEDYIETADYFWFRKYFSNDEVALVSWTGCTLDDTRLDRLADLVQKPGAFLDAAGKDRFPKVITGRSAFRDVKASYGEVSDADAIARLRGSLVGPDNRQTCAVITLTDEARRDVHGSLAALRRAIADSGVPIEEARIGGAPAMNAAIDIVSSTSLNQVIVLCIIVATGIAWWLIRNLRLMILILVTGLFAIGLSLTVLWVAGEPLNAILTTMIPMVHVAATSGSIHLCNYYQESIREGGIEGAATRAVSHAWIPLGLATATTAAGLLSICYTDLALIRTFGIYSAIGVSLSWVLLVLWLPAVLNVWRPRTAERVPGSEDPGDTGEAPLPAFWQGWGEWVAGRPLFLSTCCLLAWAACIPGLMNLKVSIDFLKEFREDANVVQDYVWLEEKLGPLSPLEVVVRFDDESPMTMLQRVRLVERLQHRFETVPDAGGAISAATYVPEVDAPGPVWARQGILNRRIEKDRPRLRDTGFLAEGDKQELWRISLRIVSLREVDYARLIGDLRREFDEELDSSPEILSHDGITATYTGVAPVLFRARRSLVDGLYWGVVTDLLLIVVAIGLMMRHWSSGFLMMFVSLFPTCIVLGATGLLGIRIDLGAIMAPCVALGVTVDDVIHFLMWYRWGAQRGLDQRESVLLAWRACVRPMYQSWALLGLGMGCLAISEFIPILQFGAIMIVMLTVGLIGNLVFLPSLLAGPLGRIISRQAVQRVHPHPAPVAAPSPSVGYSQDL